VCRLAAAKRNESLQWGRGSRPGNILAAQYETLGVVMLQWSRGSRPGNGDFDFIDTTTIHELQ
jgi:hypothetical protein